MACCLVNIEFAYGVWGDNIETCNQNRSDFLTYFLAMFSLFVCGVIK